MRIFSAACFRDKLLTVNGIKWAQRLQTWKTSQNLPFFFVSGEMSFSRVLQFVQSNKLDCIIFTARLYTIFSCIFFVVPLYGAESMPVFYQRALLSNGLSCALRLHQRLPVVQMNREFLARLMAEDSAHYLMFTLLFMMTSPVTIVLMPLFLLALFNISYFIQKNVGAARGIFLMNTLVSKVTTNSQSILKFIALNEILIFPALIMMLFSGKCNLLAPFIYYKSGSFEKFMNISSRNL